MKKRLLSIIAVIIGLCLTLCCVTACSSSSKKQNEANRLPSVDASTIKVRENESGFVLSWGEVAGAKEYVVTCGDSSVTVKYTVLDIRAEKSLVLPADGRCTFGIIARAPEKTDSVPVYFNYEVEGATLKSPTIKSYNNGVLEWIPVNGASAYVLKVNGSVRESSPNTGLYNATSYDLKKDTEYAKNGALTVEVSAAGDGVYLKDGSSARVKVSADRSALVMLPIEDFTVENGVLKWSAVGGARGYRVVDLDRNAFVIKDTTYDMNDNLLVYGVFPLSGVDYMSDAEVELGSRPIAYLSGHGVAESPFLIKTPFDLRAIDYYEQFYFEKLSAGKSVKPYCYRIENDINFGTVSDVDNIYTLSKPFYGTLDGNNKTLSGINVAYDSGYWALFDYMLKGSVVKNIKFDSPEIKNEVRAGERPIDASIATVAYRNKGTISGIEVKNAKYTSVGGEVCGICTHNYGVVENCVVSGAFKQGDADLIGQACYEMAGVVIENLSGGKVSNNEVKTLTIQGTQVKSEDGTYYNVRCSAGIVAVNRSGGQVYNNKYGTVTLSSVATDYANLEFGGIIAYNAGTFALGSASSVGTFIVNGKTITAATGTKSDHRGTQIGKNGPNG